jgi:hypothetical protein
VSSSVSERIIIGRRAQGRPLLRGEDGVPKKPPPMWWANKEYMASIHLERRRRLDELAVLAAVPAENVALFRNEMLILLLGAYNDTAFLKMGRDPAVAKAASAVRGAYDAVRKLSNEQRIALGLSLSSPSGPVASEDPDEWWRTTPIAASDMLLRMVAAFGRITGHSPHFEHKRGRGRTKGATVYWPLAEFIQKFSRLIHSHGGALKCYRGTDNALRGNIVDALELLRPMLVPDLLPKNLPAEVIVKAFTIHE